MKKIILAFTFMALISSVMAADNNMTTVAPTTEELRAWMKDGERTYLQKYWPVGVLICAEKGQRLPTIAEQDQLFDVTNRVKKMQPNATLETIRKVIDIVGWATDDNKTTSQKAVVKCLADPNKERVDAANKVALKIIKAKCAARADFIKQEKEAYDSKSTGAKITGAIGTAATVVIGGAVSLVAPSTGDAIIMDAIKDKSEVAALDDEICEQANKILGKK